MTLAASAVDLTILVDNAVAKPIPEGLRDEWGLAAAIGDVLFDTGSTVVHNARLLDAPVAFDDVAEPAHFDHTVGLGAFLDPLN